MITRNLRTIVPGTVLTVALMVLALPVLAGHNGTSPASDNLPTTGFSEAAISPSGGGGSLIWWFVGGAVVIAVIGYFLYAKSRKDEGVEQ